MGLAFPISSAKVRDLEKRMAALAVSEADFDEQFVKSSGAGGQHVNKTSTCVFLTHRPTGLAVKAQQSRSQSLNRFYARRRLVEILEARVPKAEAPRKKASVKRKQKDRLRRKRAKKYAPPSLRKLQEGEG